MKKLLSILSFGLAFFSLVQAQDELVLEGTYQGSNLYVQNPFSSSGVGFCVINVTINGQQSIDEINSSAFEIDFSSYQLRRGAPVEVKIEYKNECSPTVLNSDVIKPTSTYAITSMTITPDGLFNFSTSNESGELPFIIQQKKWNKWVKVATLRGKGESGKNDYSVKLKPHSGRNTFRIKQVDFTKKERFGPEKRLIRSSVKEVFIGNENPMKITKELVFRDDTGLETSTFYEIFSTQGLIVKKGYGSKVNIVGLGNGSYFVNFDRKFGQVIKKI
jgi:hypothetical protein